MRGRVARPRCLSLQWHPCRRILIRSLRPNLLKFVWARRRMATMGGGRPRERARAVRLREKIRAAGGRQTITAVMLALLCTRSHARLLACMRSTVPRPGPISAPTPPPDAQLRAARLARGHAVRFRRRSEDASDLDIEGVGSSGRPPLHTKHHDTPQNQHSVLHEESVLEDNFSKASSSIDSGAHNRFLSERDPHSTHASDPPMYGNIRMHISLALFLRVRM